MLARHFVPVCLCVLRDTATAFVHGSELRFFSLISKRHHIAFASHPTNVRDDTCFRNWPDFPQSTILSDAINIAASWLQEYDVIDPVASAEELLAKAAGFRGARELLRPKNSSEPVLLSAQQWTEFRELCRRRSKHEPVQYIMGEWDWHNIVLRMRPPTLIPRPETEELVEYVLASLADHESGKADNISFCDIGSGTGAIGLALLKAVPSSVCWACDISPQAVALSRENALLVGVGERYTCELSSAADFSPSRKFHVIISNPPYIPESDMAGLDDDVRLYEDWQALCGGGDGLSVVKEVVMRAPDLLLPSSAGGLRSLWLEVDVSHPALIEAWLRSGEAGIAASKAHFEWLPDLSGRPRFVKIIFND